MEGTTETNAEQKDELVPKHSRNVCSILAQYRPADTEACKYGKVLIGMEKRHAE